MVSRKMGEKGKKFPALGNSTTFILLPAPPSPGNYREEVGGLLSWTFELHYSALAFFEEKKNLKLLDAVTAFLAEEDGQNNVTAHTA